ncbi:MAG TPA: metalloregulator ArsR/SmtB family transcription factor [Candidatus Saccharimonadales bacterium]|nr:metalloregulator ArsR/SmtB family transcription factor [Candidatus Saccharimonadales bacterium]
MVEYAIQLDLVLNSLANSTRRDILQRLSGRGQTVGEIAEHYKMSFAAVSKHLQILEKAKLISKRRSGRKQFVTAEPAALKSVRDYLDQYEKLWNVRFDALEELLKEEGN